MNSQKSAGKIPQPPKQKQSYRQGINTYLKYLPRLLNAEKRYRSQEDAQRIQHQQQLQKSYGPTQYAQQLQALNQLNPQYYKTQQQLGNQVRNDLALGTQISPGESRELQQEIRGAQAARGNILGGAPAEAEAFTQGRYGQQLKQQRIGNAAGFIGLPTPSQQIQSIAPVQTDRSMAYVNPNAGFQGEQFDAQNYQNQLGAYGIANQQSGQNPWMSILGTVGQVAGAVGSAALLASDKRNKKNIKDTGLRVKGVPIKSFQYKKHIGVMAQDVEKKFPGAVMDTPVGKMVNFSKFVKGAMA